MIKKGGAAPGGAYIFLGPETGKKQDAIDAIREKIKKSGASSEFSSPSELSSPSEMLEETVFYAGETPAALIADAVQNHSLFAQSRLFIIKNADQIKKKDEINIIASCMSELDAGTTLILVSDEFKLAAGLDDLCPRENRKIFYELFENEKNEWVKSFFRREGRDIDPDGIDTILEMVENTTDALRRECSRLLLFLPAGRPVRAEDVDQWLSHSREESAFTLFSRIAVGDSSKAFEALHTLLASKESAQGILAGLAWCFRKLRDYLVLRESGEPDNFELKKIGLSSPKNKSDYSAAARRYDNSGVCACLALTAEYDILTRASGAALETVLMDVYLLKIFKNAAQE